MHQKPDQMEDTRWEGQNFSEVVAPQEEEGGEEEEEEECACLICIWLFYVNVQLLLRKPLLPCCLLSWHKS
jgi:hypothetical protein